MPLGLLALSQDLPKSPVAGRSRQLARSAISRNSQKPDSVYERLSHREPSPQPAQARRPRNLPVPRLPRRAGRAPTKRKSHSAPSPRNLRRRREGERKTKKPSLAAAPDRLCPSQGGQIFQSQGLVSIDRSMVAALLSTTPRLTPRSSTNDLAPLHCTGIGIASASGRETDRPAPPGAVVAVAFPPRSRRPRISLPPNVEVRTVSSRIWAGF